MSNSLANKVILVTGAARGLGKAICLNLTDVACTLIMIDRRADELAAIEAEVKSNVRAAASQPLAVTQTMSVAVDLRDVGGVQQKVGDVLNQLGRVDILINNAGTNIDAEIETETIPQWDDIIETNLRGPRLMAQLVWPYMKRQRDGLIVNVLSSLALRVVPKTPAYSASKWGLRALSQALYLEGTPHNIRVTAFIPAGMATPLILDRKPDFDQNRLMDPAKVAQFLRQAVLELDPDLIVPEVALFRKGYMQWP